MTDLDALRALARAQNGLFTAEQARSCGLSRKWVARRVGVSLSVVLPQTYWTRTGPPPRDVLMDAGLLYAGGGAVLSHWTAAAVWGFRCEQRREVHVTTPLNRQVADVPGRLVAHRSSDLAPAVRRTRASRPLTSVERTVVDLTSRLESAREVRALTADVVQRGKTTPAHLMRELSRRPSLPGLASVAEVLSAVAEGARSVLEIELREVLRAADLPAPVHDAPVVGGSGRNYRVDNLWPDARLIVEVDGREWHLSPDDWERDLERMADLVDADYTVLRFTARAIRRRSTQTAEIVRRQLFGGVRRAAS